MAPSPPHPRTWRPAGRPPDESLTPAILHAALQELATSGFEGLSVEQVARRAGTAKTSIYRRWADKDTLVVEALRFYLQEVARPRDDHQMDTGTLRGDLLAHALRLVAILTPQRVAVLAGLLLAIRSRPQLATMVRAELVQAELSAFDGIIRRAAARGEIAATRVPSLARQVLPSVLFTRMFVAGVPVTDAVVTELVDEVIVPLLEPSGIPAPRRRRSQARR